MCAPPRKPPPEAPTTVATLPPPRPSPPVMDLARACIRGVGNCLAPVGSGLPNPPSGPLKRFRSPPTGESVNPTHGPNQRRKCDQDGGRGDEPHERGPDPPPSRNGRVTIRCSQQPIERLMMT